MSGAHKDYAGGSPSGLCEVFRQHRVKDVSTIYREGQYFSYIPPRCRVPRTIYLKHEERFPAEYWHQVRPEDRQRLPRHQWPEAPDSQA